jgi:hypothetical protein
MNRGWILILVACWAGVVWAEENEYHEVGQEVMWSQLRQQGKLPYGKITPLDKKGRYREEQVEFQGTQKNGGFIPLVEMKPEFLDHTAWNFMGQAKWKNVQQEGYIGMWLTFADGRTFFLKTITGGTSNLLFRGTQDDWVQFYTPFTLGTNLKNKPVRIRLAMYHPGPGTVCLTNSILLAHDKELFYKIVHANFTKRPRAEDLQPWSLALAGVVAILLLAGVLAARGQARILVLVLLAATFVVGLGLMIAGLVGYVRSRDWWVAGPMLALGTVQVVVPAVLAMLYRVYRRRTAETRA